MVGFQEYSTKEGTMRLLMYYDGKDHTKDALKTVKARAKALNAKVHVLSSLSSWGDLSVKIIREIENGLHYIKGVLDRENIPCYTHLLIMGRTPAEDIIDVANKYQVDEIIIGTDRTSMIRRLKTGRPISHVISQARCPVLIV